MDKSKEYMKMTWQLDHEFWELFKSDNLTPQSCMNCHKFVTDIRLACCEEMKRISSPRQDQLQEMTESTFEYVHPDTNRPSVWSVLTVFWKWSLEEYSHDSEITSMEQLWFAFVMKEKFNKTWNGSEWIS